MERRLRTGIPAYEPLDAGRRNDLARYGTTTGNAPGSPAPPETYRPLAGAQANNRGNSRTVVLPTFGGGPAQLIPSILETPKNPGIDAEALVVQLSMDLPANIINFAAGIASGTLIDVTCVLEWGVGGAFFSAELDWGQGVSFSLSANWVRVSARVAGVAAMAVDDIPITLHASVAYGNANSFGISSAARRTLRLTPEPDFQLAAGATSSTFPIPFWAIGCTLVDGTDAVPDYTIFLRSSATLLTGIFSVLSRSNLGNHVEGQFPIAASARAVAVRNNLLVPVTNPTMIFNLGF